MSRGFTLLEVLISIAILSVALAALFSSEVGAAKLAQRARLLSEGALLGRCKMGEIEELIAREGLPAVEKTGEDSCCEHVESKTFNCTWTIDRIEIPESTLEDDALGESLDLEKDPSEPPTDVTSIAGPTGPESDQMASLAMSYAFPVLKPFIEEQVRRATVTVQWSEGKNERSFDLVQYLVAEQGASVDDTAIETEEPES